MADATGFHIEAQKTVEGPPSTQQNFCRCLRSKEMYVHSEEPAWSVDQSHSGIFWCIHTQNCLGPDGQAAEPQHCTAGRACYEAV